MGRRWNVQAIVAALAAGATILAGSACAHNLKTEGLDVATARGVYHFTVEVADTDKTREHGLMFRKSLAANRGMLFDFKTVQTVTFWMENTLIPLDMLFMAPDGRVISVAHDAVPLSKTLIPSGGPVLGVLEIKGGRAAKIGVEPGDMVRNQIFRK